MKDIQFQLVLTAEESARYESRRHAKDPQSVINFSLCELLNAVNMSRTTDPWPGSKLSFLVDVIGHSTARIEIKQEAQP